jgi:hypothetical protein
VLRYMYVACLVKDVTVTVVAVHTGSFHNVSCCTVEWSVDSICSIGGGGGDVERVGLTIVICSVGTFVV